MITFQQYAETTKRLTDEIDSLNEFVGSLEQALGGVLKSMKNNHEVLCEAELEAYDRAKSILSTKERKQ